MGKQALKIFGVALVGYVVLEHWVGSTSLLSTGLSGLASLPGAFSLSKTAASQKG